MGTIKRLSPEKMVPGPNGRGKLYRGGRPDGAVALVTRTFQEFSQALLDDPVVREAIRTRLLDELKGIKSNPLPCLAVVAAASGKQKASPSGPGAGTFIAQIIGGRGRVERVELGTGEGEPALEGEVVVPVAVLEAQKT
jgi:hypothetical protein